MKILLTTVIALIIISLIWKLISRRHQIPCPAWLGWMVEMDNPLCKVTHAKNIVTHLGLSNGIKVVDIGCGPGRVTIPLAKALQGHGTVTALDIQPAMLDKYNKKQLSNA